MKLIMIICLVLTQTALATFCAEAEESDGIPKCPCSQDFKQRFQCTASYFPTSCQGNGQPGDLTGTCGGQITCLGPKKLGKGIRPYNMRYWNTPDNCIIQAKVNQSLPIAKINKIIRNYVDGFGNVTAPPCYSLTPGVEVIMFNKSHSENSNEKDALQDCGSEPDQSQCLSVVVDPETCVNGVLSLDLECPTKFMEWPLYPFPKGVSYRVRNGSFSIKAISLNVSDCTAAPPVIISPRQALRARPPTNMEPSFFVKLDEFIESGQLEEILMYIAISIAIGFVLFLAYMGVTCFWWWKWCIVQSVEMKGFTQVPGFLPETKYLKLSTNPNLSNLNVMTWSSLLAGAGPQWAYPYFNEASIFNDISKMKYPATYTKWERTGSDPGAALMKGENWFMDRSLRFKFDKSGNHAPAMSISTDGFSSFYYGYMSRYCEAQGGSTACGQPNLQSGILVPQNVNPAKNGAYPVVDFWPTWWGYPFNGAADTDLWWLAEPEWGESALNVGQFLEWQFPLLFQFPQMTLKHDGGYQAVENQQQEGERMFFTPGKEFYFWEDESKGWSVCTTHESCSGGNNNQQACDPNNPTTYGQCDADAVCNGAGGYPAIGGQQQCQELLGAGPAKSCCEWSGGSCQKKGSLGANAKCVE